MRGMSVDRKPLVVVCLLLCSRTAAADEISFAHAATTDASVVSTDLAKEVDTRLLLFSTLSGNLYGVEQETGKVVWKIKDRPAIQVPRDGGRGDTLRSVFLPDPKDGSLYVIAADPKERIRKLGFTIPELVTSSPCRSSDGILYTGKKKDTWFVIDPRTGDRQQVLGWDILHGPTCPVHSPDAVYIGRTEYSLRMVDAKAAHRRWNVTFYEYAAAPMSKETAADYELLHFACSSSGTLMTLDRRRAVILWENKFDSPIVGAYLLDPDGLVAIPFRSLSNQTLLNFASNLLDENRSLKLYPTLYIGEHAEGLYALPSFVDQNIVTITNADGHPLLLEGPDGERRRPSRVLVDYPLPGQDYPLPHDTIMDTTTFQSVPAASAADSFSIIYLGHYDVPKYSTDKLLLAGQQINTRQITDESSTGSINTNTNLPEPLHESFAARMPWLQMAVSFLTAIMVTAFSMQCCTRAKDSKPRAPVETPDGCVRIGKISFDKAQLLGKGCEGTFVFRGEFEGRRVAVKRLLPECFDFADREVALLRESDAHPNVVRYFCTEQDAQFRYIALELCQATLCEFVTRSVLVPIERLEVLRQAAAGLAHLHALNIVHRDIKPQNILLSVAGPSGGVRAMISDFGLSKKLSTGRASFSRRSGFTGTDGWIAPEMMCDDGGITSAVDLFSLGCLFYYVLTDGAHPFGDALHRQANILSGAFSLTDEFVDAPERGEVYRMVLRTLLSTAPAARPSCAAVLKHPMFWRNKTVLAFLQDVSDRVEKCESCDPLVVRLETRANCVVRGDWKQHIDPEVSSDLRKYRTYNGNSVRDLLRALRNKKHHFHDLIKEAQLQLGEIPDKFATYWTSRFPLLLVHTWWATQVVRDVDHFAHYYERFEFDERSVDYSIGAVDAEKYKWQPPADTPTKHPAAGGGDPQEESVGLYRCSPRKTADGQARSYNNRRKAYRGKGAQQQQPRMKEDHPVWLVDNQQGSDKY